MNCDHVGYRRYAERTFSNGTKHICVQCLHCGAIERQDGKLWIRKDDVPVGKIVMEFDEELYMGSGF